MPSLCCKKKLTSTFYKKKDLFKLTNLKNTILLKTETEPGLKEIIDLLDHLASICFTKSHKHPHH